MRSRKPKLYGHSCDYCDGGWVRCVTRARELIRVSKTDYVALENVPIGVCNRCKAVYYHASVLRQAEAAHGRKTRKKLEVPVARYVEAS